MKPLKILSIGAGAIGTYIGGSLILSGNDVVFLEKPERVKSFETLTLELQDQNHTIPNPNIAASIQEALTTGPFDIALFALKSFDTEVVLSKLAKFADKIPPILCLQNGVENEEKIAKFLGDKQVIPATVTSAIGKINPGHIMLEKFRGIGISSQHPLSETLYHALNQANLNAQLFDHPLAMKWSKMLTNLVSNATSAILALPPGNIFSNPKLFDIEMAQLNETLAVMNASDIPVVDLPGTPVRLLALAVTNIPHFISRPLLKKAVIGGRGDKMPSFYIDMQMGRAQIEVDYLNGAVVRKGNQLKISTPVNSFLTQTLLGLVRGEIPKDNYKKNIKRFLQDFAKYTD